MQSSTPAAEAHSDADHYRSYWRLYNLDGWPYKHRVRIYTDSRTICTDCPTEARLINARGRWNTKGYSEVKYVMRANTVMNYGSCNRPDNKNYVFVSSTGFTYPDSAAETQICVRWSDIFPGREIRSFNIRVRTSPPNTPFWWTGKDSPPSSDYLDWFSVAVHELGHGTGWIIHFGAECAEDKTRATMCEGGVPGTRWLRSLEEHDIHTYRNAYGWYA